MAWNPSTNKSLNNQAQKDIGPGAPVAQNPGYAGKPYRDSWDIERAYREGMQKVTWVSRCIDAIAGNQAQARPGGGVGRTARGFSAERPSGHVAKAWASATARSASR